MTEDELRNLSLEELSKWTLKSLATKDLAASKDNQCPKCNQWFNVFNYSAHLERCDYLTWRKSECLRLYELGYNNSEISEKLDLHLIVVGQIIQELELESNFLKTAKDSLEIVKEGVQQGKSFHTISKELEKPLSWVAMIAKRNGISSSHWQELQSHVEKKDSEILEAYHSGCKPANHVIKKMTGYDLATVSKTLKKYGLVTWDKIIRAETDVKVYQLHQQGHNNSEIARLLNISNGSVGDSLQRTKKALELSHS